MTLLKLGFPTRLLEGPLRDKIRSVGKLGANGIQFDLRHELRSVDLTETGKRQIRHLIDEVGLALAPAMFPIRRALIEQEGLEERVAGVMAGIRFAAELKMNSLIIRPGAIPEAESPEHKLLIEVLNDLARVGDHVGVTPTLTTGRETPEKLSETLKGVITGPIGVNFDPAASVMAGHDPAGAIRVFAENLRHIRVRDGLQEADGAGIEVPVGRGEVEWESLLASVAEADYRGWLSPDRTSGEDPAGDAARAISYIKNVMPF